MPDETDTTEIPDTFEEAGPTFEQAAEEGYLGVFPSYANAANETDQPRFADREEQDTYEKFNEVQIEPAGVNLDVSLADIVKQEKDLEASSAGGDKPAAGLKSEDDDGDTELSAPRLTI